MENQAAHCKLSNLNQFTTQSPTDFQNIDKNTPEYLNIIFNPHSQDIASERVKQ